MTLYSVSWVPCSNRLVAGGANMQNKGVIQVLGKYRRQSKRERQKKRDRVKERDKRKKTDRERHWTDRQKDRQTDRQAEREKERERDSMRKNNVLIISDVQLESGAEEGRQLGERTSYQGFNFQGLQSPGIKIDINS